MTRHPSPQPHVARVPLVALFLLLVAAPLAFAQDAGLLEQGKLIYDETAGGVGCAYCHGLQGRGDGTAGVGAPDIAGAHESAIRSSLAGAVPMMGFIQLAPNDLTAVIAYVAQLGQANVPEAPAEPAEPAAPENAPSGTSGGGFDAAALTGAQLEYVTVNVDITENGYVPEVLTLDVGQRVQIVLRNRTFDEHHYKVEGLIPANPFWLSTPVGEQPEDMTEAEHESHHAGQYVAWRDMSPGGIQPTGGDVHLWAFANSPSGGKDVMIFTPTNRGTFRVSCPLHPDVFVGEVRVQ